MRKNDVFRRVMGILLPVLCVGFLLSGTGCSMKAPQLEQILTAAEADQDDTMPEDEFTPPEDGISLEGPALVSADPLGQMIFAKQPIMLARSRGSEVETVANKPTQSY